MHVVRWLVAAAALLLAARVAWADAPPPVVIDDFESGVAAWQAMPATGVSLAIAGDAGAGPDGRTGGRSMRLDVDFHGGGGYAVAHRAVSLDLPENYRFRFRLRGDIPPENLEFKLIDSSGENVWWSNQRDLVFPAGWEVRTLKKRHLSFAWGPAGGGELRHVAAIEFAVTAGSGGRGSVWIDDLVLEPLPPPDAAPPAPVARASSEARGAGASLALDGAAATAWRSKPGDRLPALTLDLRAEREFGGLTLDWADGRRPADLAIELSDDGRAWRVARAIRGGRRARDFVALPEAEARWLRVRALSPAGPDGLALAELALQPLEWGATRAAFMANVAQAAPRGAYPRGLVGEQSYWTVVGVDSAYPEALLDENGALEIAKAGPSIEPFVRVRGRTLTWADGTSTQWLANAELPLPGVQRDFTDARLWMDVSATPVGPPHASAVIASYRLRNTAAEAVRCTLYLAVRPFQVNPPTQFLNTPGGVSSIARLAYEPAGASGAPVVRVDGRRLLPLTPPTAFGATTFDAGDVLVDGILGGALPPGQSVLDSTGFASGALAYALDLAPKGESSVTLVVPFGADGPWGGAAPDEAWAAAAAREALQDADARTQQVNLTLSGAPGVANSVWAQVGWVRVNRDSVAIQPGSRSYERSWIRDGALTSSAMLRLGQTDVARDFARWFARFQYADGKVPCCADYRGADPVPEHDSHGEFIFLVAEVVRYTGDRAFAEELWPHVSAAAAYLDRLRAERMGDEWRAPDRAHFYGLLPPSISHEGYSAKPMHSYWDDFFALRGYKDAAYLARFLGLAANAAHWDSSRAAFERDLRASIAASMRLHGVDYVPGCADLGDFDATSTTIALSPCGADSLAPPGAYARTFERYWTFFTGRRDGATPWDAYTPYEMRNIGAMVHLGWRDRAHEALQWFLTQQKPQGWHQWPEVVKREERKPFFVGDLPHTWVGTDFVRSVLDMFAYVRESDSTLVVAGGIPWAWVEAAGEESEACAVEKLRTPFGRLDLFLEPLAAKGGAGVAAVVGGGMMIPPGGVVVAPPAPPGVTFRRATVDGRRAPLRADGTVVVRRLPARVEFLP